MRDFVLQAFTDSATVKQQFVREHADRIVEVAKLIVRAFREGHKVLLFGNGGSATDAAHIAAEFVGRYKRERAPLPAIALATDIAAITCIANDYGYENVFTRQIEGLGREGDVAFGISTSGRSPNVLAALTAAKARGMTTIALTGRDGGPIGAAADIHVNVAEASTARVQEVHRTAIHAICTLVEQSLKAKS